MCYNENKVKRPSQTHAALLVLNSTATPGGSASGKRLVVDNGALKAAALCKKNKTNNSLQPLKSFVVVDLYVCVCVCRLLWEKSRHRRGSMLNGAGRKFRKAGIFFFKT